MMADTTMAENAPENLKGLDGSRILICVGLLNKLKLYKLREALNQNSDPGVIDLKTLLAMPVFR